MNTLILTGSSGGIGNEISKIFVDNNFFVIGVDKKSNKNSSISFVNCDLNEFSKNDKYQNSIIEEIKNKIPSNTKKLVLINNAAKQILSPVNKIKYSDWLETLNVNLLSPFFLIQNLIPELSLLNGQVINISSIHSKQTKSNFTCYAASKSAIESITRSLSIELPLKGISINSISPGAIDTQMLLDGFENDTSKIDLLKKIHPSKTIGDPSNLAKLALFIAKSDIFLNGSNYEYNGGISNLLNDID